MDINWKEITSSDTVKELIQRISEFEKIIMKIDDEALIKYNLQILSNESDVIDQSHKTIEAESTPTDSISGAISEFKRFVAKTDDEETLIAYNFQTSDESDNLLNDLSILKNDIICRVEKQINKTPTSELRNLLSDINILLYSL